MSKEIEDLTDDDLAALWPRIGGSPHLFEHGKDELKECLSSGDFSKSTLKMDYYTMAAIVDTLRLRGFETHIFTDAG